MSALGWITAPFGAVIDGAVQLGFGIGMAVVLCVVLVRVPLFGIAARQARATWQLRQIQPEVARILESAEHGVPRQERHDQLVALYREHRVAPFSPVASIVPQFAVLTALYFAVAPSFVSDQHFAGVALSDMARSSPQGVLAVCLYVAGFMAAILLSTRRSPTPGMGTFTRVMMLCVPLGALAGLPFMSVGLALYLLATAATSLLQAWLLLRMYPPGPPASA